MPRERRIDLYQQLSGQSSPHSEPRQQDHTTSNTVEEEYEPNYDAVKQQDPTAPSKVQAAVAANETTLDDVQLDVADGESHSKEPASAVTDDKQTLAPDATTAGAATPASDSAAGLTFSGAAPDASVGAVAPAICPAYNHAAPSGATQYRI